MERHRLTRHMFFTMTQIPKVFYIFLLVILLLIYFFNIFELTKQVDFFLLPTNKTKIKLLIFFLNDQVRSSSTVDTQREPSLSTRNLASGWFTVSRITHLLLAMVTGTRIQGTNMVKCIYV